MKPSLLFQFLLFHFLIISIASANNNHAHHDHTKKENHTNRGHRDNLNDNNEHNNHRHADNLDSPSIIHKEDDHHNHGHKEIQPGKDEHDHGHGGGKAIGKGKAIEEVHDPLGFKLSKEAITTLNIKLKTLNSKKFKIQKNMLVTSKDQKGIYRYRNGYFKFLPIKIINEVKNSYLISTNELFFGDQVVTSGVGLLRVSDIFSTDKSEYGHSH